MKFKVLWIAGLMLAATATANAGVVIDNTITGSITNNFDSLASGAVAGLISQSGAMYGERFAGQSLTEGPTFDVLSGTPSSTLTLLANSVLANNIGLLAYNASPNVIYGDLSATIGEGALSILLDAATDVFGMDVVGSNGGAFTVQFFAINGSLLGTIAQGISGDGFFGFRATAGEQIRGVSITNTDLGGIGYDNVTFNAVSEVPEPASIAMWGLGALGLVFARRKRRQTKLGA